MFRWASYRLRSSRKYGWCMCWMGIRDGKKRRSICGEFCGTAITLGFFDVTTLWPRTSDILEIDRKSPMNSKFKWTIVGSSTCIVVLLLLAARSSRAVAPDDVYGHLKVYTEVLQRIKMEYVEEPDIKSVTLGAINGLLESVDPFASYLNADQYRQYEKGADTSKAGVGLVLAKRYGYVAVVDALPGSPAEKANISTGDLIESINNVATRDMPLAYAEQLLRGDANSTVELTVLRLRNPDPQKMTLTRTAISYPAIMAKMMPDEVGYLHVTTLGGNSFDEVKTKLADLKKQGAKYIVLDLRHCSTGDQEK